MPASYKATNSFFASLSSLLCIFLRLWGTFGSRIILLRPGYHLMVLLLERQFQTTTNLVYLLLLGCCSSLILFVKWVYNLSCNLPVMLIIVPISSKVPLYYWSLWMFTFGCLSREVGVCLFHNMCALAGVLENLKKPSQLSRYKIHLQT